MKSESDVAQSCPTLRDPMDCRLPGSSIHGIFQAKSTGVGCHCLLPYVLYGEGSIQVRFPLKNLGCLQDLAAAPGPSQVSQTVLLAALVSVSPACGVLRAESGKRSGTRASLAALQGCSFLPGACRRGHWRPQAPRPPSAGNLRLHVDAVSVRRDLLT